MVRPIIVGCRVDDFSAEQLAAFREYKPLGLTIFAEPAKSGRDAVRHVIRQFREAVGRPDAPAFIDQEGGRVNRLKPEFGHGWRDIPAAETFAALALRDIEAATKAVHLNAQLIAADMRDLGITVDFGPVLDVFTDDTFEGSAQEGFHAASDKLKTRMLGRDPQIVARLGRAFCEGLLQQGVVPVIKHIPGYGRVKLDPHYHVTIVDHDIAELEAQDFIPFHALRDMPAAMTGHVTFSKIDPDNSSTLSPKVIAVIRERIGFKNLLITDAIDMCSVLPEAFDARLGVDQFKIPLPKPGMVGEITKRALTAGCDLIVHGDNSRILAHTIEMLEAATPLSKPAFDRVQILLKAPEAGPLNRVAVLDALTRSLEKPAVLETSSIP